MSIMKHGNGNVVNSKTRVRLIPRYLQSSTEVNSGDLAKRMIDESYFPEQSASVKRFEERLFGILIREKQA